MRFLNKRELNLQKYGISGKRYKELCGFCEQYPDWKKELEGYALLKSPIVTDLPGAPLHNSDMTGDNAIKRCEYETKCTLIEETAKEAVGDIWQHMIANVCYEVPVKYLIMQNKLYMSQNSFYDLRRYFFYLLDKKKK